MNTGTINGVADVMHLKPNQAKNTQLNLHVQSDQCHLLEGKTTSATFYNNME